MTNETFGFVTGKNSKEKTGRDTMLQRKRKRKYLQKEEILSSVRKCETLEDILNSEVARPFISSAWLNTPEAMIVRKMRNNAIKKFPKDLNSMASSSLLQLDETYKVAQEEIKENENSQEFAVEDEPDVVVESEAVEVETPEFAKE